jgi:hypothetical protein
VGTASDLNSLKERISTKQIERQPFGEIRAETILRLPSSAPFPKPDKDTGGLLNGTKAVAGID